LALKAAKFVFYSDRLAVNVIGFITLPHQYWIERPYRLVCGGPDIGSTASGIKNAAGKDFKKAYAQCAHNDGTKFGECQPEGVRVLGDTKYIPSILKHADKITKFSYM
jgi:hypothetical protein